MAIFIPEWTRVSGAQLGIKQTLKALDDSHVVRRPLSADTPGADFYVEHATKGWLALSVVTTRFEEIDPGGLLDTAARDALVARLRTLSRLATTETHLAKPMSALIVTWACTTEQVSALTRAHLSTFGVRFISKDQFLALGAKLVSRLMAPLSPVTVQGLLATFFPEAEIALACTARRRFERDNRADLPRLFLDSHQEWAAKLDLELPDDQAACAKDFSVRLVNGVAGSGKTLIAINRAIMLAEMRPDQRLLVLIHNTPIVADIKDRLHRQRGGWPANLTITTFFAWASGQWRLTFRSNPRMHGSTQELLDLVRQARSRTTELRLSDDQVIDELDFINDALIVDEAGYLEASRAGRGFGLRGAERSQVWAVYESVSRRLAAAGVRLWSALPRDICLGPAEVQERLRRFDHVLIDEAQFFAPSWFQLVKLSMQPEGQLFLCADPNQGFMKSRLSWKRVGLDVAGRTKKLRKSYRTTREILQAADSVLAAIGRPDADDYLQPDFEGMEPGVKPMVIYPGEIQDSIDMLVNIVGELGDQRYALLRELLIIHGSNIQRSGLIRALSRRLGPDKVWALNEPDQKKEPPHGYGKDYLRIASLETATGLEGGIVFLLGMEDLFTVADSEGLSDEARDELREKCARKLYMAMTRAADRLVLVSSRPLPAAAQALFEVVQTDHAVDRVGRGQVRAAGH